MKKSLRLVGSGLKYAGYLFVGTVATGFGYLQYVNQQVGPIQINRELSTKFYINELKMDPEEAKNMYYWLVYDIALMRILTYRNYSTYCDRLNRKIIAPIINNYQNTGILQKIQASQGRAGDTPSKKLFKEVGVVRKENFQGLADNEYIVKELRKQQKLMDTRKVVGLEAESLAKINKIHSFICETGVALKESEVEAYVAHLPEIQLRFPGDILHKLLFI